MISQSSNPWALVTGASRGIGRSTVLCLAREGWNVLVNYRVTDPAALVQEIRSLGVSAEAFQADVSDAQAVEKLFACIDQLPGPLRLLVNNAGILEQQMRLADMTPDRFDRVLAVNVKGPLLCSRAAIPRMQTGGVIVNVSSLAAVSGSPNEYVDYAASKGALDTLTIGLARELAPAGIRVCGVRPGFIATDIHASGGDPGRLERLKTQIPMRRWGEASEVAETIAWLASEKASYVTGTIVDVAGGR